MRLPPPKHILLILLVIFTGICHGAEARPLVKISRIALLIHSEEKTHQFNIELADSPSKWEHGLMYRKKLAADHGMLFVFPRTDIAQFWMKNTLISLDMLFIDSSGKIIKIKQNATPESLAIISSGAPVKAVLEVAGGTTEKLDIKIGDMVSYADVFKSQ